MELSPAQREAAEVLGIPEDAVFKALSDGWRIAKVSVPLSRMMVSDAENAGRIEALGSISVMMFHMAGDMVRSGKAPAHTLVHAANDLPVLRIEMKDTAASCDHYVLARPAFVSLLAAMADGGDIVASGAWDALLAGLDPRLARAVEAIVPDRVASHAALNADVEALLDTLGLSPEQAVAKLAGLQ